MESPLSAPEPGTLSIDIWSDVMCPFCCLGDRHLELALEQFELLLEEQAFPFEERAIETFETNLKRISQGIYDEWIRNSYQQLVTIAPGLYGRVERGEAVYEPFN